MLPTIPSLRKPEYQIPNSLRFRSSASAYLSRTFTTPTSNTTWTWSGWVKRGALGVWHSVFNSGSAGNGFSFSPTNNLIFALGNVEVAASTAVFRDPSAYYHLVVRSNGTNIKGFVNNLEVLSYTGTIPAVNSAATHYIFCNGGINNFVDGYLAEVHFVDGQALTPAAFGATSSKTGVWAPRKYTGTYGTNGFYLDFVDNSAATSATIGKDRSGNYNSWTPTNISMVAGSTYDSMTDTPTQYGDAAYYYSGTQYPYNALNFRSSASTYLSRTIPTGDNKKWTWSSWVKLSSTGARGALFSRAIFAGSSEDVISIESDNTFIYRDGAAGVTLTQTSSTFASTSTWYHIVYVYDSAQAVQSDRGKFYVNGVLQAASANNISLSRQSYINTIGGGHAIGSYAQIFTGSTAYFNGYMADVNFIDGQALTPASFGETINGTWVPKTYTGAYGTNGFNLKFNDNSAATAAALGRDSAGTNNWTPTNLATTDVTSTEITSRRLVNPSYGLQFRSSASAYLSTTLAAPTNNKICTWSSWVKGSSALASAPHTLINANPNSTTNGFYIVKALVSSNDFGVAQISGGSNVIRCSTVNTFSDAAAWYHVVVAIDTTQATNSNGVKLYVNGVQQTLTFTAYSQNASLSLNSALPHQIGRTTTASNGSTSYLDGILADVNFIDGQALTPASFGETDGTGTWVPKTYTGTYGTNGFYLNFADRSAMTAATIGNDASSNSNNWTPTNMAIADAIDYGARTARGNYAVLNPLDRSTDTAFTLSNSNLTYATNIPGTIGAGSNNISSSLNITGNSKYYFEVILSNIDLTSYGYISFSLSTSRNTLNNSVGIFSTYTGAGTFTHSYRTITNGVLSETAIPAINSGSLLMFAVDSDTGKVFIGRDGTWYNSGSPATGTGQVGIIPNRNSGDEIFTILLGRNGAAAQTGSINFGQRPFAYTPPAGFKALNTNNLPEPAIVHGHAYMAATTYTGTGVGRNISNFSNNRSFRPDLVWIKSRSNATDHALYDTLRGAQQDLVSNSTAAETTQSTGLTAFREDGFGLSTLTKLNSAGNTYVAWQWKAGDSVVTNTAGSITSQVDAGTTQGVSVVTYTGTGANATVGHGLGVAPSMVIVKSRAGTGNWQVRHTSIAAANSIQLNGTAAAAAAATVWNSTAPTSSVFTVSTSTDVNASGVGYVAYCFAEIAGYSKFGSYTGNGSADGPFCFTGFRPRWVMVKTSTTTNNWFVWDTTRGSINVLDDTDDLYPNTSNAEPTTATYNRIDILSNGFKVRASGATVNPNATGETYIFAAFAEVPSKYALAR